MWHCFAVIFKCTKNIQKLPSVKVVQVGLTNDSVASWSDKMKNMSESDFVGMMRQLMDKNITTSSMVVDPVLIEASSGSIWDLIVFTWQAFGSCDHSEFLVPTSHDNHFDVPVLVHVPKVYRHWQWLPLIQLDHCLNLQTEPQPKFLHSSLPTR